MVHGYAVSVGILPDIVQMQLPSLCSLRFYKTFVSEPEANNVVICQIEINFRVQGNKQLREYCREREADLHYVNSASAAGSCSAEINASVIVPSDQFPITLLTRIFFSIVWRKNGIFLITFIGKVSIITSHIHANIAAQISYQQVIHGP